ncbi:hypothetical protein DUNSADRAFT_16887 [Dunaliella salina]|uniref:Encoded protein n=1 Tax=Dunaliella salina TaxID=3046 RepID=A0ABQ7H956_DUNSA|nr:hypothetical protein DUNSADRAFT_16887 [Dunaliella salina]|eukprot:KAF5843388.1 hypothetical protein DUNSADRAFT_16887 [Dunaliella salina]
MLFLEGHAGMPSSERAFTAFRVHGAFPHICKRFSTSVCVMHSVPLFLCLALRRCIISEGSMIRGISRLWSTALPALFCMKIRLFCIHCIY